MGILDSLLNLFSGFSKKSTKKKKPGNIIAQKPKKEPATLDIAQGIPKPKKTKKKHTSPPQPESTSFSISLKGDGSDSKKRGSQRITLQGLALHVHRLKKRYPVTDLSTKGVGFRFEKPRIKAGVKIKTDLILKDQVMVKDMWCRVRRHENGNVGCHFLELNRSQDTTISKLVLQGQKEQAARRAARKNKLKKTSA